MLARAVKGFLLICLSMSAALRCLTAYAQKPAERLQKIIEDNTLEREGKKPFHLKIAFQLYDLDGKPSEKGTVEEWWVSKTERRVDINAPSVKEFSASTGDAPESYFRELSLIEELLRAEATPLPNYTDLKTFNVSEVKRTEDRVPLRCILVDSQKANSISVQMPHYCFDSSNDALRLRIDAFGDTVSRNLIGSFHDTNVALDLQIAFGDRLAMTGHVLALSTFDPATTTVQFPAQEGSAVKAEDYPELMAAGKRVTTVQPQYPPIAEALRREGIVVLRVRITKDGSVKVLSPISRPNSMFTSPTEDAVSQWKYSPFILDGKPVEVDTTIYVDFRVIDLPK
jgi:TonB family protein